MADVIRLVCPECDAVHRVKSVTLGKLYRCKKCRSGLITMQPAILVCPNCGATTPPAHIEASKLITCEECEKAPLMEVRLPGVEYPKAVSSDENVKIASVMSVVNTQEEGAGDDNADSELESEYGSEVEVVEVSPASLPEGLNAESEESENEGELDETRIFRADTNFIVKSQQHTGETDTEEDTESTQNLQQLNIFENTAKEAAVTSDTVESEIQDDFDSEEFVDTEELMPEIEVASTSGILPTDGVPENSELPLEVPMQISEEVIAQGGKKKSWGWSIPAWIPAVFALLLIGLYGLLYADLTSMRVQLEKSQESIIRQDQSFQQERKKYLTLIRSTQNENRKLRNSIMELTSENSELRRKSISFEVPEIKD